MDQKGYINDYRHVLYMIIYNIITVHSGHSCLGGGSIECLKGDGEQLKVTSISYHWNLGFNHSIGEKRIKCTALLAYPDIHKLRSGCFCHFQIGCTLRWLIKGKSRIQTDSASTIGCRQAVKSRLEGDAFMHIYNFFFSAGVSLCIDLP